MSFVTKPPEMLTPVPLIGVDPGPIHRVPRRRRIIGPPVKKAAG
jgi:hypothetical protein